MLAPSWLTSLDNILRLILYQEHSLTLDMCKDHCTVAGLWYSTLPGLWFLNPLLQSFLFTTSVVMLESGRYLNRLVRGACGWFSILHTAMRYLPVLPPSHHLQSQWWFGILFITPHIPGGSTLYTIYTLDMFRDHCTVADLWYVTLPGLWFLSPLLQSFLVAT